jgi:hypothetical protein
MEFIVIAIVAFSAGYFLRENMEFRRHNARR